MPRHLQSIIHSEKSDAGLIWSGYNQQIIDLWNSIDAHGDFNDHLIREYNKKIDLFDQPTGLFFAPYDAGYRFIGSSISLPISGFAYPNETLTAPSGSSYQWYVDDIARGTDQTLTLTVNDIGLSVRCIVGAVECTPVTVWHPRDIANVKNFWWAAQGAYNLVGNNVTDANASINFSQPIASSLNRAIGNDQNGKAAYGSNFGTLDTTQSWCYWNGSQWVLNIAYDSGDNPQDYTYYSSNDYYSETAYPWQATSWTGAQTVTRQVTTYDVLATDNQTVAAWRDIISAVDVTASASNIALFEATDLASASLKFDSTDFFTIPTSLRTVFNSQDYGYIFAGIKDTSPTAGDVTHGIVSINRTSSYPKVALTTRILGNNNFSASTGPNGTAITQAEYQNNSAYNVLTNEASWIDGDIRLRVNGSLSNSNTFTPAIPNSTTSPSYIGAYTNNSASNFNGYMTAIILATGLMSDTDRNRTERFIGLLGTFLKNKAYDINNIVLFEEASDTIPSNWVSSNNSSVVRVEFKLTLTTIGGNAFALSALTSVIIPDSVTSLGNGAFFLCASLSSVTIGSGITTINSETFQACAFSSITIPSNVTSIADSVFSNNSSLTSFTIPDTVTSFGTNNLNGCSSLTSVTIGSGITTIPNFTFTNCTSLTSITIPSNITSIGDLAFYNCTSLGAVIIPNSVTSLGSLAFLSCTSLASATIGSSITSIPDEAFRNCTSLATVNCLAMTAPTVASNSFQNILATQIHVPIGATGYGTTFGGLNVIQDL